MNIKGLPVPSLVVTPLMVIGKASAEPSMVKSFDNFNVVASAMICPESAGAKIMVSPIDAAPTASRKEQSELQTPSLVSAIFVTVIDAAYAGEVEMPRKTRAKIIIKKNRSGFMSRLQFQNARQRNFVLSRNSPK
jgi:hypothetical protein